jgi:hypothetical protein
MGRRKRSNWAIRVLVRWAKKKMRQNATSHTYVKSIAEQQHNNGKTKRI